MAAASGTELQGSAGSGQQGKGKVNERGRKKEKSQGLDVFLRRVLGNSHGI